MISYPITYDYSGGTGSNPSSYTVEDIVTLQNPTKSGYNFAGWTGSNGTTVQKNVTIPAGSTGAKSYTAVWGMKDPNMQVSSSKLNSSNVYTTTSNSNTMDFVVKLSYKPAKVKFSAVDGVIQANSGWLTNVDTYTFNLSGLTLGSHTIAITCEDEYGTTYRKIFRYTIGSATNLSLNDKVSGIGTQYINVVEPGSFIDVNGNRKHDAGEEYLGYISEFTYSLAYISGHADSSDWTKIYVTDLDGNKTLLVTIPKSQANVTTSASTKLLTWSSRGGSGTVAWNPKKYVALEINYYNAHSGCATRQTNGGLSYDIKYESID